MTTTTTQAKPATDAYEVGLLGPTPDQYATLDKVCAIQPDILYRLVHCKPHFLADSRSIMGHILHKPFGYAGDFKIIDRIYQLESHDVTRRWDEYALQTSAAKAVRNRKSYFIDLLEQLHQQDRPVSVLNVASGPARDIYEFLKSYPDTKLRFTCIDMDQHAIEYAMTLNRAHLDKVTFVRANVLRYKAESQYDLVWSAGLFDYFSDSVFTKLIRRMTGWVAPGGQLVVGNFNADHNPSRAFMEIVGEWYLQHRTAEQLRQLAIAAECSSENICVGEEAERVNLFLHIKPNPAVFSSSYVAQGQRNSDGQEYGQSIKDRTCTQSCAARCTSTSLRPCLLFQPH